MQDHYPTLIGVCFALGGPALLAVSDRLFSPFNHLTQNLLQQLLLVGLCAIVLSIILGWERQPLSSIGLHPFHWQAIAWGLGFAGILIFIYSPLLIWAMQRLNLPGFGSGLSHLSHLPVWYLILAVVVGGTVEEILYRGYATERLSAFTGSYWVGSVLALIAFGLAHVPLWGWVPAGTTVISGGLLTLFYLWTGDLLPCILAHILTDSVGLILTPTFCASPKHP
jgi:membrane protease YdiL (CAAX protease family)